MNETIQQKMVEYLKPLSKGLVAADVRIGLGYTSVRLDNGNIGLAWTAKGRSELYSRDKGRDARREFGRKSAAVEKIISEGGGTMILKRHLVFETIVLKR